MRGSTRSAIILRLVVRVNNRMQHFQADVIVKRRSLLFSSFQNGFNVVADQ